MVATALTVYGIETVNVKSLTISLLALQQHLPFTVLKRIIYFLHQEKYLAVATALTVYGIETRGVSLHRCNFFFFELQQHLPFTVLKLLCFIDYRVWTKVLQQYLPFTVLKRTTKTECSKTSGF